MSGVIGQSKRLITKYMRREVTDKVPTKTVRNYHLINLIEVLIVMKGSVPIRR